MAGRGPQSFKKRQKEQQRKEKQQEKLAKKVERERKPLDDSAIDFDNEIISLPTDPVLNFEIADVPESREAAEPKHSKV
jgi:hypothetical protein